MVSEVNLPNVSTPVPGLAIPTGKVVVIHLVADLHRKPAVARGGVAHCVVAEDA
jgi:hypothetical protein